MCIAAPSAVEVDAEQGGAVVGVVVVDESVAVGVGQYCLVAGPVDVAVSGEYLGAAAGGHRGAVAVATASTRSKPLRPHSIPDHARHSAGRVVPGLTPASGNVPPAWPARRCPAGPADGWLTWG